ncbi:MAG TPA: hypothetical protein VGA36_05115 [Nitriliruptorales bacterium]
MANPVQIAAITSNASLVVALTLRVEDWDITSGGSTSTVEGLEQTDVLLIDRGTTELGLAELMDARIVCPLAPAIVIGDREPDEPTDATLLLRPFTLEELADAINAAGAQLTRAAAGNGAGVPNVPPPAIELEDDYEPMVDFTDRAAPPPQAPPPAAPTPPAPDVIPLDEFEAEPLGTLAPDPFDEPGDQEPELYEPEPVVAAPEPAKAPAPAPAPPPAPEPEFEPEPLVAPIEPSRSLIVDDDEEDEDELVGLVEQAARARAAATTAEPAPVAPPSPPPLEAELEPSPVGGAPAARPDRRKRRLLGRRREEEFAGPAELAAKEMAASVPAQGKEPRDMRGKVASILVSGAELHRLVDDMPILRSGEDLADVLAGEVHEEFQAATVAVWLRDGIYYRVGGGRGLTHNESRASVSASQALLSDLQDTGGASLIIPTDLAPNLVGGLAGARTNALMATAVAIGPDRYAHVTVGAEEFTEEDLDRLVKLAVEAAPFFAIARLMDSLRAR